MQCEYFDKVYFYSKVLAPFISSNNLIFMRVYYSKLTNALMYGATLYKC